MISSIFYDTTEQESFISIAQHIAQLLGGQDDINSEGGRFYGECEALYQQEQYEQLLDRYLGKLDLIVSSSENDEDVDFVLTAVPLLLVHLPVERIPAKTQHFLHAVTACKGASERAAIVLASLTHFFNFSSQLVDGVQQQALTATIAFAQQQQLAGRLGKSLFGRADTIARELRLPPQHKTQLQLQIADLLAGPGAEATAPAGWAQEAQELRTKALAAVPANDPAMAEAYAPHVAHTIACFLRSPTVFHCDFVHLPIVVAVRGHPKVKPYLDALDAVLDGRQPETTAKQVAQQLGQEKLVVDPLVEKIRLLGLLRVAESALYEALPFADIAAEVGLDEDEVEVLLFTAMQQNLLEVSIQNAKRLVYFRRVSVRSFGPQQWAALEMQLDKFTKQVQHSVLLVGKTAMEDLSKVAQLAA